MCEEEYKQVEVTYRFYMPDNKNDLIVFQNAEEYYNALYKIYEEARKIWKYEDDETDQKLVEFAEMISAIATDTGILEI